MRPRSRPTARPGTSPSRAGAGRPRMPPGPRRDRSSRPSGSVVLRGARTRTETPSLRVRQRTKLDPALRTRHDRAQALLPAPRSARLTHRLKASRREDTARRQARGGGLRGIPPLEKGTVAGESRTRAIRESLSSRRRYQPTSAKTMRLAVLRCSEPVGPVNMQSEMDEPLATLVAQQTIGVLLENPEAAVAVLIADLHRGNRGKRASPRLHPTLVHESEVAYVDRRRAPRKRRSKTKVGLRRLTVRPDGRWVHSCLRASPGRWLAALAPPGFCAPPCAYRLSAT